MGHTSTSGRPVASGVGLGVVTLLWAVSGESSLVVATVPILLASPSGERNLFSLFLWIGGGSVVLGGLSWLFVTVAGGPVMGGVAAGLAIGGGLGAVVRLFAFSTPGSQAETLTVEMDDQETASPEPADLFGASPDPILYYAGRETPTVRAVNPAFEDAFDVTEQTIENTPLDETLMTNDTAAIVEAVRNSTQFDEVVDCDRPDGETPYRVRVVPVGEEPRTSGYVLYTAREDDGER
jgi:hypothetical protein